jgi:hypothetical protein
MDKEASQIQSNGTFRPELLKSGRYHYFLVHYSYIVSVLDPIRFESVLKLQRCAKERKKHTLMTHQHGWCIIKPLKVA